MYLTKVNDGPIILTLVFDNCQQLLRIQGVYTQESNKIVVQGTKKRHNNYGLATKRNAYNIVSW